MTKMTGGDNLVAVLLLVAAVNALTFLPSREVESFVTNPTSLVGEESSWNAFVKVQANGDLTKWQQQVLGVPVYGSVVTTKSNPRTGRIKSVQGFVSRSASFVDTRPQIKSQQATRTLQERYNHDKLPTNKVDWRIDEPTLQILETGDGFDKLVWKVSYYVDWKDNVTKESGFGKTPAYMQGLINAHTGAIEKSWDNLQHAVYRNIWGSTGNEKTGLTYELMRVQTDGRQSRPACWHRDDDSRVEVFDIWNMRQVTNRTTSRYECSRAASSDWDLYHWTKAYSPRNEAYVFGNNFIKLWREVVGAEITPYRTNNSYLEFYVHYDNQFENAFFNGFAFIFGDGKDTFYPFTSQDIVCHEIGHAITAWKGGNLEYQKESGGMNEAYSDILGETCDIHFRQKKGFSIGEDITRPNAWVGPAMRNMCKPRDIFNALDHYSQYNDNIGVHTSSGIYNKAWCTLTNTNGWDYLKAFEVFTDANLMYWNPTSTMHCGACGVEAAAVNRGYSKADVTAAFDVVGVSCANCR